MLDTCALQHIEMVWDISCAEQEGREIPTMDAIRRRYGPVLASELFAIYDLIYEHETGGGLDWWVSSASLYEFSLAPPQKAARLMDRWRRWFSIFEEEIVDFREFDFAALYRHPHLDAGKPDAFAPFDELPGAPMVHPQQLRLPLPIDCDSVDVGRDLSMLRDEGDRILVWQTRQAGFPSILTTDLRSFWRFRDQLRRHGVAVYRPTDLIPDRAQPELEVA